MPSLKRRPIDFSAFDVFLEFLPCRREPRNPPPPPRSSRNSSFQLNTTSCCIFSFLTLHFALYSFFLCMCSVHVHVAEFKTLWIERHWSNLSNQPVRTVVPCNVLCCIVFYIALHWNALHWNALHCIALHCLGLRVMDVATVSPADINASLYTARNSTNLCVL